MKKLFKRVVISFFIAILIILDIAVIGESVNFVIDIFRNIESITGQRILMFISVVVNLTIAIYILCNVNYRNKHEKEPEAESEDT